MQRLPIILVLAQRTTDKSLLETVLLPFVYALTTEAVLTLLAFFSINNHVLADATNEVHIKLCFLLFLALC